MEAMNIYPEQLDVINTYIKALNAADAQILSGDCPDGLTPGLERIPVVQDEQVIGHLVDEIGGAWSFRAVVV